ncbi:MAG: hypothetical protein AB1511_00670 [Deinococcota bacterium]
MIAFYQALAEHHLVAAGRLDEQAWMNPGVLDACQRETLWLRDGAEQGCWLVGPEWRQRQTREWQP